MVINATDLLDHILLPCLHCGYDLRASPEVGVCPECGKPYRRNQLYRDVVRQKVKNCDDELKFIFYAGIFVDAGLFVVIMIGMRAVNTSSLLLPSTPIILLVLFGTLFLWLVILYAAIVIALAHQVLWKKTLLWGQVRGAGVARQMYRTAGVLVIPFIMLFLVL